MNFISFSEGHRPARSKKITFHVYFLEAYWTDCNIFYHTNIRKKTEKKKIS